MENENNILNEKLPDMTNAEPIEIAKAIVHIADLKKARDIKLLKVADQTVITEYFVICTQSSATAVKALAGEVEFKLGEAGLSPFHADGLKEGQWSVLDFGPVILHIMNRESREFYKLEKLWSEAEVIDISDILIP